MATTEDLNEIRDAVVTIVNEALRPLAERISAVEQRSASDNLGKGADSSAKTDGSDSQLAKQVAPAELAAANAHGANRDVRKELVDAAVELFYQHGYEATSVQEIVDRASVTKGALYHYFRSKEDLLLEIRNNFMGDLLRFGRQIQSGHHSPTEALSLIIRELLLQVKERRAEMTVAFLETRVDFDRFPKAKAQRNEWEEILAQIIDRGRADQEFRQNVDPRIAAALIGMCSWAAYHWFPDETALDFEGVVDVFTELALHGLS
jgi:AcrR family transcriptional regulator